jgi:hypothetical protein
MCNTCFTFFGRYYALPNRIQKYNWKEDLLFKTSNCMGHHAFQQHSHVNICNKTVELLIFLFKKYKADSIHFKVSCD